MQNDRRIDLAIRAISAGALAILLLSAPLFLFSRPVLAPTLLLFPLLWLVRRRCRGHFVPRTPVDWPILGLLIMALVSMWATPDLSFSYRKIAGLLYGVALFYAVVDWGQRQGSVLPVVLLATLLGFGMALLGLLGMRWQIKLPLMREIAPYLPRVIKGVPGAELGINANGVAGTLIMYVPLQFALLSEVSALAHLSRRKRRWIALFAGSSALMTCVAILLSQSRLAWAALAFGLISVGGVTVRAIRPIAFATLAVGLIVLAAVGPRHISGWLFERGWLARSGETSWAARIEIWSRALWAIAERPMTGTGMDIFRRQVGPVYPLFVVPRGREVGHAHNDLLQTALDLGLPGLVCYLALLGSTLVFGWRSYRTSPHPMTRALALGGTVGLAVRSIWGMADTLALGTRFDFLRWAMLALVISVGLRGQQAGTRRRADEARPYVEGIEE